MDTGDEAFDIVKELLAEFEFHAIQEADNPEGLLDGFYIDEEETSMEDGLKDIFARKIISALMEIL